ncbi:hypothetical protein RRG08_052914, partial [Elysia crispata]
MKAAVFFRPMKEMSLRVSSCQVTSLRPCTSLELSGNKSRPRASLELSEQFGSGKKSSLSNKMAWYALLLLQFVYFWGVSAQSMTATKFESSFHCSRDYLVAGQDYTIIEYEVSGSNATYAFRNAFSGPLFYRTVTTCSHPIIWCHGFDLLTDACTDQTGKANRCSCLEVTKDSIYRFSLNLTAHTYNSKQTVWLGFEGPPQIASTVHVLPEVK